jgi:transcriptional regulator with XRE-family HTH domain
MSLDKISEQERKRMIADTLRKKGMTQQDLAVILGRALGTVQNWIRGVSIPELTPEETIQLCRAVGCSLEELAQMFPGLSRRRAAIKRRFRQKNAPE